VLDMNRLKNDVRLNAVSEYSFQVIDKTFFNEGFDSGRKKPAVIV
jgi:hypothetical protein